MARDRKGDPERRSRLRQAGEIVLFAIVYAVAAQISLRLALVDRNVTPLWPPTGIAVVGLLLYGTRLWPGVALGALAVNLPITTSPVAAAVTGGEHARAAARGRDPGAAFRMELDRVRDVVTLVAAALLSMVVSATVGTGTLVLSGQVPAEGF